MKRILPILFLSLASTFALAEGGAFTRTIFSDNFASDGFGPRWGHYKSGSVVKGGVLVGITPEGSDHSAVDNIKFDGERDLEVSVKFRFVSDKAQSFGVWFDDKDYKGSHAGHIVNVNVAPKAVRISDGKTGDFQNDIYAKRTAPGGLSDEEKALLKTKSKTFPVTLSLQEWHTLVARTKADEVEVSLDGKVVGTFKSEGVSHETKSLVSLTTNKLDVEYDDFSLKGLAK